MTRTEASARGREVASSSYKLSEYFAEAADDTFGRSMLSLGAGLLLAAIAWIVLGPAAWASLAMIAGVALIAGGTTPLLLSVLSLGAYATSELADAVSFGNEYRTAVKNGYDVDAEFE